jgi:hypothetical protein
LQKAVNRRQKAILAEVVTVFVFTLAAVVGMINFKDYVNRSEAITAMRQVGQLVVHHQAQTGKVPPESLIKSRMKDIKGSPRLGNLKYRGLWIEYEAEPNAILAYAEKKYPSSLLDDGYVVLQLNGAVVWTGKDRFEQLLASQQSDVEIEMTRR